MALKIYNKPGEYKSSWDRQVIYFANILSLFYGNEKETQVLQKEVGALATYGSRLVPLLDLMYEGPNLLVLEQEPDTVLLDYFLDIGLTLPQIEVLPHEIYKNFDNGNSSDISKLLEVFKNHCAQWVDGYVTDPIIVKIAGMTNKSTVSSLKGSRQGNNKYLLHQCLEEQGLPTFDTCIASCPEEVSQCLAELAKRGYSQAVVKAQVGASGIGMKKVSMGGQTDKIPDYMFYEGPCLVQGWLDDSVKEVKYIGSPSVQMFLKDDSINLYDITEQFLSHDSVHEGNISPPSNLQGDKHTKSEILRQAGIVCQWLHDQGYRGTASTDFHLIERGDKREVRVCEINARVTGATYPSILSKHFHGQGAWLMRNIRFDPGIEDAFLLKELDRCDMLFHTGKKKGVLPFNFNSDKNGDIIKGQFLFLGESAGEVCQMLEELSSIESIHGSYDRD